MPQISVIIPTRNRPHLLPRAVASAQAAGSDVEVIVVDDASIDETAAVCKKLHGIKYIRLDRNQGVAGARNVGLMHSEGDYITFLDDDDLRLPDSLDLQAAKLDEDPLAGFVCGAMVIADQGYRTTGETTHPGHPSGDVFWNIIEFDFPAMGLSTLIRKECLLKVGLLRQNLIGIDDWDIFVRLAELYPAIVIDELVGIYRQPTSSSDQGASSYAALLNRVAHHQKQLLQLPRAKSAPRRQRHQARRLSINRIVDTVLASAAREIRQGELRNAGTSIGIALRLNPSRAFRPRSYQKLLEMWRKPGRTEVYK